MDDGLARSLNHRLRALAAEQEVDARRLRNRLIFQRILHRLASDGDWVLKGGFALETRLWLHSRATKDLDLARLGPAPSDADDLLDLLEEALDRDSGDPFRLVPRAPRPMRAEDHAPTTWRVVVDAHVGGSVFGSATLDVITAVQLDSDEVEPLLIVPVLGGTEFTVPAVDVDRHAAEKFHAYSRVYAHERPSSRVKDLVDLTLLIDRGLLTSARLGARLSTVFDERDGHPPPASLEPPPGHWRDPFGAMSSDLHLSTTDVDAAFHLVLGEYHRALDTTPEDHP